MRLAARRGLEVHDLVHARVDAATRRPRRSSRRAPCARRRRARVISGRTPGCRSGSPPVSSTSGVPSASARARTSLAAHARASVECLRGVAPRAAQVAAGRSHERARQAGERRFALDACVDLVDDEGVFLRHGAQALSPRGRLRQRALRGARSAGVAFWPKPIGHRHLPRVRVVRRSLARRYGYAQGGRHVRAMSDEGPGGAPDGESAHEQRAQEKSDWRARAAKVHPRGASSSVFGKTHEPGRSRTALGYLPCVHCHRDRRGFADLRGSAGVR